jgi:crotonobetainyl-CoA:carnitine CoA-transferase CaiB-like acyl-CoA transferase
VGGRRVLRRRCRARAAGSSHRFLAPYQAIRCADGYITIGAGTDRLFAALCEVLGHPEWIALPEFADATGRVRHRGELAQRIEDVTSTATTAHWLQRLDGRGIPCGPINSYADAFADPQVQARDMVVELEHPTLRRTLGSPIKMSGTPTEVGRSVPGLGEHTEEVLREAGFSDDEIKKIQ